MLERTIEAIGRLFGIESRHLLVEIARSVRLIPPIDPKLALYLLVDAIDDRVGIHGVREGFR